jgi:threonine aldolase
LKRRCGGGAETACTARPAREYAALFDTVYVSLYKYFNAGSGALLPGPNALLANLYHTRRMFGGGLSHVWPFAAVALHYLDGFERRFRTAVDSAERVIATLSKNGNLEPERIANGTNIFQLRLNGVNGQPYHNRLDAEGISAAVAGEGEWFTLNVNETWARVPAAEIARRFRTALG